MEDFEIYANVESLTDDRDPDGFHNLKPSKSGPAGAVNVKKRSYRAAAVTLALLCVLLLIGLLSLVFLYTDCNSKWKMEMLRLGESNKNLTKERDELQTRLVDAAKERSKLQTKLQDEIGHLRWKYFSRKYYYISSVKKSWQESREDCLQRGADLVIINSKEEQDFVSSFKEYTWIGLTDRDTEKRWRWVDGTRLTRSYWEPAEPNGVRDRDEDCVEIKTNTVTNNWNDADCEDHKFWICEKTQ